MCVNFKNLTSLLHKWNPLPMPKWAKAGMIVKTINGGITQNNIQHFGILPISEVSKERKPYYLLSGTADCCPHKGCF
jgi:hypothetical protein